MMILFSKLHANHLSLKAVDFMSLDWREKDNSPAPGGKHGAGQNSNRGQDGASATDRLSKGVLYSSGSSSRGSLPGSAGNSAPLPPLG
jgi:hypothetical protein